ncbi:frataxin, mitochondrial isoform X2 [Cherax quadricarinatus]|nr:frataxin, mitochondrial-like isoform X2 [Cherax quadricarinatus]XP_053641962.1 frataxin, mitochondrial-like isoform X2 [Cherax quadricarinatus]XP_053641963.1 frataxin, mitochondrial-like isoform X2 [Cherax quadricarinatus]
MSIVSGWMTAKYVPRQHIRQLSQLRFMCCHSARRPSFVSQNSKPYFLQPYAPFNNFITLCSYSVELSELAYEQLSDDTLESLSDYLEELISREEAPADCDVLYSAGVLTLHLGNFGTYVINKQTPNKQIWLSSPVSGPKRYDFVDGVWIYKHSGVTLHHLLSQELSEILKTTIDFSGCVYGGSESI